MSRPEKLLRELIALPSVNPAFVSANDPHAGEQRMADFLAATAAQAGLPIEFHEVLPRTIQFYHPPFADRQNQATHPARAPSRYGSSATTKQFSPLKKNGRIYGRGACDTKGSVAAMLTALIELANGPERPAHTEIIFAGLIDEEDGQRGSRALAAQRIEGRSRDCGRTD